MELVLVVGDDDSGGLEKQEEWVGWLCGEVSTYMSLFVV